ncbi:SDR family NAD(P)-dependent oxidoreductase [Ochrobactrum sp. Marseille-Q0166]|uniref:SDR family NAD(P)-dependent oxidoreductase n=1 Tax=Ochrobactrum sp. Marseille-Q0166 TaxID=2761105 RepID=UPI00165665FE|nr:SDR family NAD(P)-dependent oxidoreductase [Ochrobactrum sp. Marseille-Q0166]MBC8718563.1 SDR family oxidoreductase [Ochrobactrum sp. Marseille-Q0166]
MMFDFSNKILLLSGANGGIGREVAKVFAAAGAAMVLADRDLAPLLDFAATLPGPGRNICLPMDADDPASAQMLVDRTIAEFGQIDYVVPSAGIYLAEPFLQMTDDQWRRTMSINLDSVFYLLRRAAPHLGVGSSIVNLTSVAAYRGAFSNAHYGATKGALVSLTRALARELAPNVRVNAVAPGIIETPMTQSLLAARGDESITQTPLGRFGKPSEIASVIAFLCSGAASFITGETIQVNGGIYMV